jgi:5-methylcytosine-specific restriction endonuclease McrA
LAELLFADLVIEEYKRDYKMEYRNYHGKPKQRKERAARTKAREQLIKKGRVKKGDGKDIDHKVPLRNGGSKGLNNLRVRDRSENRSDNGHKKGEKQNKDWK